VCQVGFLVVVGHNGCVACLSCEEERVRVDDEKEEGEEDAFLSDGCL